MLEKDLEKSENRSEEDDEIEVIEEYKKNSLIVERFPRKLLNRNLRNLSNLPDLIEEENRFLESVPLFINKEKKLVKRNSTSEIIFNGNLVEKKTPIIKILEETEENENLNESIESLNLTDDIYKSDLKNKKQHDSLQDFEINEAIYSVYNENVQISRSELSNSRENCDLNLKQNEKLKSSSVSVIDEAGLAEKNLNPKNILSSRSLLNPHLHFSNDIESASAILIQGM
jgi:hypothetical protein